ncbi:MAG: asparagine synthase (glutamine-hydrolyzing) [Thermoguttaceae bacterium]|nr:asparagine synthase (glutamine-hydrolyzing) [Thermoguttaceae bacterium]
MCGICGYLWTPGAAEIERSLFERMTDTLSHRGPDDRGVFYKRPGELGAGAPGVALGHRRLSILDLSPQGRQPMASADGALQLVFNGEIYNFPELRADLEKKGHAFRTGTDTEVILALYREYGEHFAEKMNGMFAIGLWDAARNRLLLLRDRLGKKPLFYRAEPNRLIFASELNTLLCAPGIPKEIDPIALDQYMVYQYVPHPRSIYRGISKLPPATLAVWTSDGGLSFRPYWQADFNAEEDRPYGEWLDLLRGRLAEAVRIRLRSDVPLGAFLSGGIDSTIVVGLMQKFSARKVKTYSIGFKQKEYDETPVARRTAERLGTDHHELFIEPDIETLLPLTAKQYGEPFADSSAIPCRLMCELTRREVTVALSGDGGDELFAGYDRYKAAALGRAIDAVPYPLRRFLAGPVRAAIPASTRQRSLPRRIKRFLEGLTMPPAERYLQWIAIFNRARRAELYAPEFQDELNRAAAAESPDYDVLDWLSGAMRRADRRDFVTQISLADIQTYLTGDILTKMDIASMTWGLEVRSPILDDSVLGLAVRIPMKYKIRGRKGKMILRDAFREFIPPELDSRPKTGFGVPLDHWFRGPLKERVRQILTDPQNPAMAHFRSDAVSRLLTEHFNGTFDHAARIWSLLVLSFFTESVSV